jgi:hypothetical protein
MPRGPKDEKRPLPRDRFSAPAFSSSITRIGGLTVWLAAAGMEPHLSGIQRPRTICSIAKSPLWVLCHDHRRSIRRCATVLEMKEAPRVR